MDLTPFIGLLIAFGTILCGQYLEGGLWHTLVNLPAGLIVIGGTLGAVVLETPFSIWQEAFKLMPLFFKKYKRNFSFQLEKIKFWCQVARRDGLLGLENILAQESDPLAQRALELLIDGVDASLMRNILESELSQREHQALLGARVFEQAGGYAPTLGILGAVLGLIHVMSNLSDPSRLGSGIAVAFVATVYGLALANLILLPLSGRLTKIVERDTQFALMTLEGAICIALGDGPRMIELKLSGLVKS